MEIDPASPPEHTAALRAQVRLLPGAVKNQGLKIAQVEARIAKLKRMRFGQSSERVAVPPFAPLPFRSRSRRPVSRNHAGPEAFDSITLGAVPLADLP